MLKIIRRILIGILVIVMVSILWIYRPYESYDSAKVIPELRDLQEPFKSVDTAYMMDGGSLGVSIIDANGSEVLLCIPAPMGEFSDRYKRLFLDAYYKDEGAREVLEPKHSKLKLLEILREAPNIDMDRDRVIAMTSGRWRDFATLLYRRTIHGRYSDY